MWSSPKGRLPAKKLFQEMEKRKAFHTQKGGAKKARPVPRFQKPPKLSQEDDLLLSYANWNTTNLFEGPPNSSQPNKYSLSSISQWVSARSSYRQESLRKDRWYNAYQQMPMPSDSARRISEAMRRMDFYQLEAATARQAAKSANFGTWGSSALAGEMAWLDLPWPDTASGDQPDALSYLAEAGSLNRNLSGLNVLVAIIQKVVEAWASDVVTDTMRRYAQLDLSEARPLLQLVGEVAVDPRTALLEVEDKRIEFPDPDWTAADTRVSNLELF